MDDFTPTVRDDFQPSQPRGDDFTPTVVDDFTPSSKGGGKASTFTKIGSKIDETIQSAGKALPFVPTIAKTYIKNIVDSLDGVLYLSPDTKQAIINRLDEKAYTTKRPILNAISDMAQRAAISMSPESPMGAVTDTAAMILTEGLTAPVTRAVATFPEKLSTVAMNRLRPEIPALLGDAPKVAAKMTTSIAEKFATPATYLAGKEMDPTLDYILTGGKNWKKPVQKIALETPSIPKGKGAQLLTEELDPAYHQLAIDIVRDLMRQGKATVSKDFQGRPYQWVAEKLRDGTVDPTNYPDLVRAGFTQDGGPLAAELMDDFAAKFAGKTSEAGRALQRLRPLADEMKSEFEKIPITDTKVNPWDALMVLRKKVVGAWSSAITSQLSTGVGNLVSTGFRSITRLQEDTLKAMIDGLNDMVFHKKSPLAVGRDLTIPLREDFTSALNIMTRRGREEVINVLENFPKTKKLLYQTRTSTNEEGAVGKLIDTTQIFNKTQEMLTRTISFHHSLRQKLIAHGALKPGAPITQAVTSRVNPKVFGKMLVESANEGLEATMAANPKNKVAVGILRLYNAVPELRFAYAFPRFVFNSLKYGADRNPVFFGIRDLVQVPYRLAKGQAPYTSEELSRRMIGSMYTGAAMWMKANGHAGDKYYEWRIGDKIVDMRKYYLLAQPLFAADLISRINFKNLISKGVEDEATRLWSEVNQVYSARDITEGLTGANRIAGVNAIMPWAVEGAGVSAGVKGVVQWVGEILGGFTVPIRTFKDLVAGISPEEAKMRDKRESVFGPFLENIPFASQTLPEEPSIFQREPKSTEHPLLKQLGSVRAYTKTPLEQEMDRVGIKVGTIIPRTGVPEADRQIKKLMGQVLPVLDRYVENAVYKQTPMPVQEANLRDQIQRIKNKIASAVIHQGGYVLQAALANAPAKYQHIIYRAQQKDFSGLQGMPEKERRQLLQAAMEGIFNPENVEVTTEEGTNE